MTNYNYSLVISYKLISKLSAILVLPYLDVVAADNDIATLGGILLNFPCLS